MTADAGVFLFLDLDGVLHRSDARDDELLTQLPLLEAWLRARPSGDGLEMLGWLESALGALDRRAPRAALEKGVLADRVLDLASGEGL